MKTFATRLNVSLPIVAVAISLALGCRSETAQAAQSAGSTELSGPPVVSALWGTRMPRECARVTTPPTAAQATALIQCHMDHATRELMWLMQNVNIQMTGSRPFGNEGPKDNIDNSAKIYDLVGSNDYYTCSPVNESVMHNTGKNCSYTRTAKTTGECWKVLDGSYRCELSFLVGPDGRANTYPNQPGPTTY